MRLGVVLRSAVWMAGWALRLPMVMLYLLLLASGFLTCWTLLPKSGLRALFWSSFFFSSLAFGHIALLALASLCLNSTLGQTYSTHYAVLALFSELGLALISCACFCADNQKLLARLAKDSGQFRQCLIFLLYTVIYYCFDALLVQFDLLYWQVSAFVLGSSFLIAFQLVLFILDTDNIIRLAAHKVEYDRLEEQRAEQIRKGIALRNLAYRDSLTGAYNRRYAEEMLASWQKDYPYITVAYIDIDGLKKVNDSYGHQVGDRYVCAVANCLNNVLCKTDVLARIGGDEFLVISTDRRETALSQVLHTANAALRGSEQGFCASFSFGVVETEGVALDIDTVLRESDRRMYRQKTGKLRGEVNNA